MNCIRCQKDLTSSIPLMHYQSYRLNFFSSSIPKKLLQAEKRVYLCQECEDDDREVKPLSLSNLSL